VADTSIVPTYTHRSWPQSGPVREFLVYLHELHKAVGQPSMREMAAATHLGATTISQYLTGVRLTTVSSLPTLIRYLGGDLATAERLRRAAATAWNESQQGIADEPSAYGSGLHIAVSKPPSRPNLRLPLPSSAFVGRQGVLGQLSRILVQPNPVSRKRVLLHGVGGIGKTTIAQRWIEDNQGSFPDGILQVDVKGFHPQDEPMPADRILRILLRALGVPPEQLPLELEELSAVYLQQTDNKAICILIDNARAASQVTYAMPAGSTAAFIATSRKVIPAMTLHGAETIDISSLSSEESFDLFAQILGRDKMAQPLRELHQIVNYCQGLPLAIAIAASRIKTHPNYPLNLYLTEISAAASRLDALDEDDQSASIRAVLETSHKVLSPDAATLFHSLGVAPGADISRSAIVALTGWDTQCTGRAIRELVNASLVIHTLADRYMLHDLVRLYAKETSNTLESQELTSDRICRLIGSYVLTAHAADRVLAGYRRDISVSLVPGADLLAIFRDDPSAMMWLQAEHEVLLASLREAEVRGWRDLVWNIAWCLDNFHWRTGRNLDDLNSWNAALKAGRELGADWVVALAHRRLGRAYGRSRDFAHALSNLHDGAQMASAMNDLPGAAHCHRIIAWLHSQDASPDLALTSAMRSVELYSLAGDPVWEAHALCLLGSCLLALGRLDEAREQCGRALDLHREHSHDAGEAEAIVGLGDIEVAGGRHAQALDLFLEALAIYGYLGNTYDQAECLERSGNELSALHRTAEAEIAWRDALSLYSSHRRKNDMLRIEAKLNQAEDFAKRAEIDGPTP
jgi:tetratricopeptide (TPR) repeat protein